MLPPWRSARNSILSMKQLSRLTQLLCRRRSGNDGEPPRGKGSAPAYPIPAQEIRYAGQVPAFLIRSSWAQFQTGPDLNLGKGAA